MNNETNKKFNVYIAGPMFTIQDRRYLEEIKTEIEKLGIETFLPHLDNSDNAEGRMDSSRERLASIFKNDYEAIDRADAMIALLDGVPLDCRTTWEIGYAFANKKPVIGVRTDFRVLGNFENQRIDLMSEVACSKLLFLPHCTFDQVVEEIKKSLLTVMI